MKSLLFISMYCLLFLYNAFTQNVCYIVKIETPAVSKPADAAIVSSTCSTLVVRWKGAEDQSYIVNATYKDPATNQAIPTALATDISCDNNQNCTATIPVTPSSKVSWNVQSAAVIDSRTFYSYPLRADQDYAVPDCNQPISKPEDPIAVEEKFVLTAADANKEKLAVSNDKLAMYPNPVNNILNIKFSGEYKGTATLMIVNITGQGMKTMELNKQQADYADQLNVSSLKPGMYYLNIQLKNGRFITTRFIKN